MSLYSLAACRPTTAAAVVAAAVVEATTATTTSPAGKERRKPNTVCYGLVKSHSHLNVNNYNNSTFYHAQTELAFTIISRG